MAYWRWLIIDEISMVNARLLAQAEARLRAVIPSANAWKTAVGGEARPFAGLNVIFTGDFHQLPPPEGKGRMKRKHTEDTFSCIGLCALTLGSIQYTINRIIFRIFATINSPTKSYQNQLRL